jgi:hypothetical protein
MSLKQYAKQRPAVSAMIAATMAAALVLSAAPALSSEAATADDTARFLAGLPPSPNSPLATLAKNPSWQEHARRFNSIFAGEESTKLSKVRAFSQAHLTDQHQTMLYMFSGPDFLYATSFFPDASTYVMAGLEPIGDIPQLTGLKYPTVERTLYNLENSLTTILNYSFFITRNMKTQLSSGTVYGTLPILYVFLARTGKTIHDVSLISIDADGNVLTPLRPGAKHVVAKPAASAKDTATGANTVERSAADAKDADKPATDSRGADNPASDAADAEKSATDANDPDKPAAHAPDADRRAADAKNVDKPAATAEAVDKPGANTMATDKPAAKPTANAVRIVFSDGDSPEQTLYYFSTNLQDGSVQRSGFLAFCNKLAVADSLIKSASYLLHGGGFTKVRSFLLEHSATILEDDSGIPLAYFNRKVWRLEPFGRYVGPLSLFGRAYQPGMAQLFGGAAPLDFGIGYRWQKNESNLLLSQKLTPGTSAPEVSTRLPTDQSPDEDQTKPKKRITTRLPTDQYPDEDQTKPKKKKRASTCPGFGFFMFCSFQGQSRAERWERWERWTPN